MFLFLIIYLEFQKSKQEQAMVRRRMFCNFIISSVVSKKHKDIILIYPQQLCTTLV